MENTTIGGVDVNRLQSIIERIERLEEEKRELTKDINDIYAEAKGAGYDVKILREIIKLRRKSELERQEEEYLLDTYRKALNI